MATLAEVKDEIVAEILQVAAKIAEKDAKIAELQSIIDGNPAPVTPADLDDLKNQISNILVP